MGRARQQLHGIVAASTRLRPDPFAAVLGHGRGLQLAASLERDTANINALLEDEDVEAITDAFFRYRTLPGPTRERMRTFLGEHIAYDVWIPWWHQGMGSSLRMLGLGTENKSPWLLSQEHKKRPEGHIRTIHIADLRPDLPCSVLTFTYAGATNDSFTSLCGLGVSELNKPRNARALPYHLHRGDWRAPSKINARRCERCSSLAQGLSIPALTERAGGIRSGEFTGAHLPALGKRAVALLARAPSYEHVHASINKVAYAIILERLVAVVSADPVPIVMATLDVTERKSLVRFAQADLHARLQTLDWQQILEGAIPHTRPTDECNHLILRAHLEKATRDLPY